MPAGLNKITNYYNKLEAWKDWNSAFSQALSLGLEKQATELMPLPDYGWRKIDARLHKLRALIRDAQLHVQPTGVGADAAHTTEPVSDGSIADETPGDQPRSGG